MAFLAPLIATVSAAFTAVTSTALGSFLFRTVASIALSALAQSLQKKPTTGGISTDATTAGGIEPQKIILGTYATGGGAICPPMSFDYDGSKDLKYITYVTSMADYPITDLNNIIIDGKVYNILNRESPAASPLGHAVDGTLNGYAWVRYHNGTQTTADTFLVDSFATYPNRPWSTNHKLIGVPYAITTYKYKSKKFSGLPEIRFEVKGAKLYDPRKDSTIGGSGNHRFANPTTWEFSDNPIVMVYNLIRGLTLADGNVYGIGASAETMPVARWFAAMNTCDEAGSEPLSTKWYDDIKRYRAGIEFTLDAEPLSVIEEILASCGGQLAEVGGFYNVTVGPPDIAAIAITDESVIISEERSFKVFNSLNETYNAIHAAYPSPADLWETKDAEPAYYPEWELEDDNRRLIADLKLGAVPFPKQVRRLMREGAADNRRAKQHTIVLGPWSLSLIPLDTISWTSVNNNYVNKKFEITSKVIDSKTLNCTFQIKERDPADYDADNVFDSIIPGYVDPNQVKPIIAGIQGLAVYPVAINNDVGKGKKAGIRIEWAADLSYKSINYEIRNAVTDQMAELGSVSNIEAGYVVVAGGILPSSQYKVRVIAKMEGRESEFSSWLTVTTPSINLDFDDFEPSVEDAITAAILAGAVSEAAVDAAQDAQAASVAAQLLAQSAANSANASFIAANNVIAIALGHANNAALSANQSSAAALASNTAKNLALGYMNSANGFSIAASGFASTANSASNSSSQSALASAASAASANVSSANASSFAAQAASAASNASGFAAQALTSANTSASILSDTQRALNSTSAIITAIPNPALLNFGATSIGLPESYSVIAASGYGNDSGGNYVKRISTGAGAGIYLRNVVNSVDGNVYRVTVRFKPNADLSLRLRVSFIAADGSAVINGAYKTTTFLAADGIQSVSMTFGRTAGGIVDQTGGTLSNWTNAAFLRFGIDVASGVAASDYYVYSITVDDVTSIDQSARQAGLAAGSAAASLVSEGNALAYSNNAGSFAQAANTSATMATTAAGNAATFAAQSANSATQANGFSAAASLSQTAAAQSANSANGSAQAAAGFAASANLSSNSSLTFSQAALASATAANTSAGLASTSAGQAATAASNASGFAGSAATSSNTAVNALSSAQIALATSTTIITGRASIATLPYGIVSSGTVESFAIRPASEYSSDVDGVYYPRSMTAASQAVILRGMVPSYDGAVYRVTAKVKTTFNNNVQFLAYWINADGTVAAGAGYNSTAVVANTYTTISMVFGKTAGGLVTQTGGGVAWVNAASVRFGIRNVNAASGEFMQVYDVQVDDLSQADAAARSQILSANSASASSSSADSAAASANASAQSASASQASRLAANTAAGNAQAFSIAAASAASNANSSAVDAASSAGLSANAQFSANTLMNKANTFMNSANGYAIAASNSASMASAAANSAGLFSAQAADYRDTTAKLVSAGASQNPVFNDWTGSTPNNVTVTIGTGTVTKDTANAKYLNSMVFSTNATTPAGSPIIQLVATTNTPNSSVNPAAIITNIELGYVSGNTIGTCIRAGWQKTSDSAWVYSDVSLTSEIEKTVGKIQNIEIYLERPASLDGVAIKNFNMLLYPTATLPGIGAVTAACSLRLHKFDYQVVTAKSATAIYQAAKVSIDKVASAAVGMRAVAGSAGALLELVALDDPILGTTSTARINANNIILNGSVRGNHIAANTISTDKLYATSLSSISATIGILRTATSGARQEIHSDKILIYDASNVLRVRIGNLS